jgi:glycosyltransferase involved in cell wall biosynthesis
MASAIHVTSEAEAEDVARLGYGDRARVIPLGVDVGVRPSRRARPASGSEPLRLLFLSRLHEKKNVPLLLRALATATSASRRIELTIAGGGDPGYRDQLAALADRLGLRDVVSFAGYVDGLAKERAFAEADCFVLPSAHENFGLAVAEALAADTAIVDERGACSRRPAAGAGVTEAKRSRAGVGARVGSGALTALLGWTSRMATTRVSGSCRGKRRASALGAVRRVGDWPPPSWGRWA